MDIEQIKADREAGTRGDWQAFSADHGASGYTVAVEQVDGGAEVVTWTGFDFRNGCAGFKQAKADAERIARVPDLEAQVIADTDRIAELEAEVTRLAARLTLADELDGLLRTYADAEAGATDTGLPSDYEFVFECWRKVEAAASAYRDSGKATQGGNDWREWLITFASKYAETE